MFSKEGKDFLESLPFNMCDQNFMQVQKENRKRIRIKNIKNKSENRKTRIKFIVCTLTYLPENDAKDLT